VGGYEVSRDVRNQYGVFILAENLLLREALTRILSKKSDIRVVGACAFSPQVVEQVAEAAPYVLLSDSTAAALTDFLADPRSTRSGSGT
jgi:DNA-binding NarL/FixJ family response regulator